MARQTGVADVAEHFVGPGNRMGASSTWSNSPNRWGAVIGSADEAIEGCPGNPLIFQDSIQGIFVHDSAPRRVEQIRVGLIRANSLAPIRLRVLSLSGQWIEIKSALRHQRIERHQTRRPNDRATWGSR